MWLNKIKLAVGVVVLFSVAATGVGFLVHQAWGTTGPDGAENRIAVQEPADPPAGDADDARKEIEALRREIGELRKELSAVAKDIRKALPRVEPEEGPLYQGKPLSYWLEQAKDADPSFRVQAVQAFRELAQQEPTLIPVLIGMLGDRSGKVGSVASKAMPALGGKTMPLLIEVLERDECPRARARAAEALGHFGPRAKETVPSLIKALDDAAVQHYAFIALARIGPDAKPATVPLVYLFEKAMRQHKEAGDIQIDSDSTAWSAAFVLLAIDPSLTDVFPVTQFGRRPIAGHFDQYTLFREAFDNQLARWENVVERLRKRYPAAK